jgi:hypothetical protein
MIYVDIERSHGLHFVRNINHDIQVKCISFNIKQKVSTIFRDYMPLFLVFLKEIVSIDHKQIARRYHSDGRAYKKLKLDIRFDQLFYCINEDEFIAWSRWTREIHVLSSDLEILSTSICDYNIGDLNYNETTSDVFTCGRGNVSVSLISRRVKIILNRLCCIGLAVSVQSKTYIT